MLPIGAIVGDRYRIEACLGSDDTRAIFEAIDAERDATCALKLMRVDDPDAVVKRARVIADMKNEHIVGVLCAGCDQGLCFVATELLRGADLGRISRQSGPLPPERVVGFIHQLARALEAAHERELFHGGLCPASLFLTQRADGTPLLVLLGLEEHGLLPRPSKDPFCAPDQGPPSSAGDIYALGHIAQALLTGEPNLDARQSGVRLSPDFERWLSIAAAPDPKKRFVGALEAASALELVFTPRRRKIDALSKTLPAEDDNEPDPRPSVVDPLGDTHGMGMALSAAAKKAIAAAPKRSLPPPATAGKRTTWLLVLAVVALAALALFAALRP